MALDILRITDPGCPFAWSAEPAMTVLRSRYRDQIEWSLAMIGLAEDGAVYEARGYGPVPMAQGYQRFSRQYGMPVTNDVRKRPLATWPACRVVIAAGFEAPERQAAVHRALQVAWFTTVADLEQDDSLIEAISPVAGIDASALVATARTDDRVEAEFELQRAKARSADGSPTMAQGKHAMDGDLARYTAPSLLMADRAGRPLEAGGFQPVEAYDVIIANADPTLERHSTGSIVEVLELSDWPLCTAEIASALTPAFTARDDAAAESELIALAAEGRVERTPAGNGTFWSIS